MIRPACGIQLLARFWFFFIPFTTFWLVVFGRSIYYEVYTRSIEGFFVTSILFAFDLSAESLSGRLLPRYQQVAGLVKKCRYVPAKLLNPNTERSRFPFFAYLRTTSVMQYGPREDGVSTGATPPFYRGERYGCAARKNDDVFTGIGAWSMAKVHRRNFIGGAVLLWTGIASMDCAGRTTAPSLQPNTAI
jgi:hypothetical protein